MYREDPGENFTQRDRHGSMEHKMSEGDIVERKYGQTR